VVGVHQAVGTLVVVIFLVLTVGNIMRVSGKIVPWTRPLSMVGGLALLVQYLLGFSLLADDHSITAVHYLFALAAIVTVGLEHSVGRDQSTKTARTAALATAGTTILTLIAYAIGSSN
jgi:hypothetical protein